MRKIFLSITIFALTFLPALANAANMYLILDKNQVPEQGTFSGTVYVSTGGLPINNAESTIHFPSDLLSVDSISTAGSIFNIWVEQPSFSNTAGTIYFNGGLPTPGYSGQSGNSIKVNFRAKKAGTANLSFGSSAVRANDGQGTDVLSQITGAMILITSPAPVIPTTPVVPVAPITPTQLGVPKAPVITSEDMPDQNAWYNKTDGLFSWELPSDVKAVQLVLSRSADTAPSVVYDPPIKNKNLTDLAEGVMYLNARFKNDVGWSKITNRKIQIDITNPENLSVATSATEDDLVSVEASAKDSLSGMKSFAIYENGKKITETNVDGEGKATFSLPPLNAGDAEFEIRAYDKAGNYSKTNFSATVPETKAPKITHYPEYIKIGGKIEIRGKAPYTGVDVNLWFKEEGKEAKSYLVKPDEDKIFSYTSDSIETLGVVNIWAETVRGSGVKSSPSEKVYVSVKESDFMWLGTRAIQVVSLAITFLVLLFLLLLLIFLGIKKSRKLKRDLRRDLVRTEQEVHKVFEILKGDTKRHIKMLERASTKRKLTKEESKIFTELSEDLDETEKYLSEKIKNIEENDL